MRAGYRRLALGFFFCTALCRLSAAAQEGIATMATAELKDREVTEAQLTAADVMKLFRKQFDEIEAALPLSDREAELLECLAHDRRPDGRLLRVRAIKKRLRQTTDEIHDVLGVLERKGLIARPTRETGTYRLEVLAAVSAMRKGGAA